MWLPRRPAQLHTLAQRRMRRNPVQMQQLKRAHPQRNRHRLRQPLLRTLQQPRTRASSAICQRSTPITSAVVRFRSSGDSASTRAECSSSSLCPLPSPTSFKISNAASRAGVIFAIAVSTPAVGPADAGRFLANTGLPAPAFDALSFPA